VTLLTENVAHTMRLKEIALLVPDGKDNDDDIYAALESCNLLFEQRDNKPICPRAPISRTALFTLRTVDDADTHSLDRYDERHRSLGTGQPGTH
jgi:hypothetical protein